MSFGEEMLKEFIRGEEGQDLVEYTLLLSSIVLVASIALSELGDKEDWKGRDYYFLGFSFLGLNSLASRWASWIWEGVIISVRLSRSLRTFSVPWTAARLNHL